MKKSRFILSIVTVVMLIITGCTKEITTEDNSKITNFVTYELEGGSLMTIPKGSAFVDPGFVAMEGTQDVTNTVDVDGSVNGLEVGLYELTYSAVNKDGYASSVSRTVIIYDPAAPATDMTGNYTTSVLRYSPGASTRSGYTITVTKLAPGFFSVSDFFGGWYAVGSGYGPSYAMNGYIMLNADNTLTLVSSLVRGWGDSLDQMINGTYDPGTKVLFWRADYAGFLEFNVTATFQS